MGATVSVSVIVMFRNIPSKLKAEASILEKKHDN